jgi:hypothetical protein
MLRRILLVLLLLGAGLTIAFGRTRAVRFGDAGEATADNPAPTNSVTFSDDFSGGTLDSTKWFVDTGRAPGNIAGVNTGTLNAKNVDLSTGMLRLTLNQSVAGAHATSAGAEIRSKQLFGYGTYVWVARQPRHPLRHAGRVRQSRAR